MSMFRLTEVFIDDIYSIHCQEEYDEMHITFKKSWDAGVIVGRDIKRCRVAFRSIRDKFREQEASKPDPKLEGRDNMGEGIYLNTT